MKLSAFSLCLFCSSPHLSILAQHLVLSSSCRPGRSDCRCAEDAAHGSYTKLLLFLTEGWLQTHHIHPFRYKITILFSTLIDSSSLAMSAQLLPGVGEQPEPVLTRVCAGCDPAPDQAQTAQSPPSCEDGDSNAWWHCRVGVSSMKGSPVWERI